MSDEDRETAEHRAARARWSAEEQEAYERYERGTCARKKRYASERKARQAARHPLVQARLGRPARVYLCPWCLGYHLSSTPERSL